MNTKIKLLSIFLLSNIALLSMAEVQENYVQFEAEYEALFNEKPSSEVWQTVMATCGQGSGNCSAAGAETE